MVNMATSKTEYIIHASLYNPVILTSIFSNLSTTGLKKCRLVCQAWEKIATLQIGQNSFFSINNFYEALDQDPMILPRPVLVKDRLAHRVKYLGQNSDKASRVIAHEFIHVFSNFSRICNMDVVKELYFYINWRYYESIYLGFNIQWCVNLTKLSIHEVYSDIDFNEYIKRTTNMVIIQEMPTVQVLELFVSEYETLQQQVGVVSVECHPVCHALVASCKNLTRLIICGNFYPSLTKCLKLKYLSWKGIPVDVLDYPPDDDDDGLDFDDAHVKWRFEFSLSLLLMMLGDVKDALVELQLSTTLTNANSLNRVRRVAEVIGDLNTTGLHGTLKLHNFPRLVKLCVDTVQVFKVFVDAINPAHFPALEELKLSTFGADQVVTPTDNSFIKISDIYIRTLKFAYIDLSILPLGSLDEWRICTKFPNLINLRLEIVSFDLPSSGTSHLKRFLTDLTLLKNLEHLSFVIKSDCTVLRLFEFFCVNDFERLKTLTFVVKNADCVEDTSCYDKESFLRPGPPPFERSLHAFKNITFKGFVMKRSITQKMMQFSHLNDLRINFFP